jgi:6,7-dimethyl-8-ribityllumazine synthase
MADITAPRSAKGRRFAVIVSRFNEAITGKLLEGALDALERHGAAKTDVDVMWVPGAWELPMAGRRLFASDRYDALIALGAVIRGDTPHFDYVAGECARGLAELGAQYGRPVGFGVLTCDTMEQAEARAGGTHGNKGWDAALAAIDMAALFNKLDEDDAR